MNQPARTYLNSFVAPAVPDVSLTFTPLFQGARRAAPNEHIYEAAGISFNTRTGVCTVGAAPLLRNFIVEVVATPVPADPDPAHTFREVIRFHVHHAVTRTWMTPRELTVRPAEAARPEDTNYRFTVHAQYDDDTVADVTLLHGVTWEPAANFAADGRISLTVGDPAGDTIDVTATYPTPAGDVDCEGQIRVGESWANEANPPRATIVPGAGWPWTIRPQSVPNVLFLGDGFENTSQDDFEKITNAYVDHLRRDKLVRPFDVLATSINIWRTFVAGPRGISVRSELYYFTQNGKTIAKALPKATKPIPGQRWNLENMIYAVGLPAPADANRTSAELKTEWALLLREDPTPHVNDRLIDQWKQLANRAYAEELDSFPGLSYGQPPAANRDDNYLLALHDGRGGLGVLRTFYPTISTDSGVALDGNVALGNLWAPAPGAGFATTHFDNSSLVALVSSIPGGRAQNQRLSHTAADGTTTTARHIVISTQTENFAFEATLPHPFREVRLTFPDVAPEDEPNPPPGAVVVDLKDSGRTMAHELGHSFGLNDEYAERLGIHPANDDLASWSNVQPVGEVRNGGQFDGDAIKWNWHRIKKAALIEGGVITGPAGGPFTIPVRLGHGLQFDPGDRVLLRERPRGVPLTADPDVLDAGEELRVVSRTSDTVVVAPVTAGSVDLTRMQDFDLLGILFIPVPAPDSVRSATYPYAEIVALNVKNEITNGNRPLWAHPANDTSTGPLVQSPNLDNIDLPGVDWCFKNKPRIIGLYEGGVDSTHGVYHPAGSCMMRNNHDEAAEFCHVCRYVMVDMIDPSKHFEIDRDYEEVYAQG